MPFDPTPLTKAECEAQKDDFGIKECYYRDDDYCAGAVAACCGVSKLPTMAQVNEIAKYVYPSLSSINSSGYTYCPTNSDGSYKRCIDYDRVSALGFSLVNNHYFDIWSGEETDSMTTYYRNLFPDFTPVYAISRLNVCGHAVCIKN